MLKYLLCLMGTLSCFAASGDLSKENFEISSVSVQKMTLRYKMTSILGRPIVSTSLKWSGDNALLPEDLSFFLTLSHEGQDYEIHVMPKHSYPSEQFSKSTNKKFKWDAYFLKKEGGFASSSEAKLISKAKPMLTGFRFESSAQVKKIEELSSTAVSDAVKDELEKVKNDYARTVDTVRSEQLSQAEQDQHLAKLEAENLSIAQQQLENQQVQRSADLRLQGDSHLRQAREYQQRTSERKMSTHQQEVNQLNEEAREKQARYERENANSGSSSSGTSDGWALAFQALDTVSKELQKESHNRMQETNRILAQQREYRAQQDAARKRQQAEVAQRNLDYQRKQQLATQQRQQEYDRQMAAKRQQAELDRQRREAEERRLAAARKEAERKRLQEIERQRKLALERKRQEAERQRRAEIERTKHLRFAANQSSITYPAFKAGENKTGTMTIRNITLAGVRISSFSVKYKHSILFGELVSTCIMKWVPANGESATRLPNVNIVLGISTTAGSGTIDMSPLVSKPNKWSWDVGGSPNWNSWLKSGSSYYVSKSAKAIFKAGGSIYIKELNVN